LSLPKGGAIYKTFLGGFKGFPWIDFSGRISKILIMAPAFKKAQTRKAGAELSFDNHENGANKGEEDSAIPGFLVRLTCSGSKGPL
jgi:hypothetical protein